MWTSDTLINMIRGSFESHLKLILSAHLLKFCTLVLEKICTFIGPIIALYFTWSKAYDFQFKSLSVMGGIFCRGGFGLSL